MKRFWQWIKDAAPPPVIVSAIQIHLSLTIAILELIQREAERRKASEPSRSQTNSPRRA